MAIGVINFVLNKSNNANINNTISFVKVCMGVRGIQSPKQPHALIFPVNKTYEVRKVKNNISNNNIHTVNFFFQPMSNATPTITSSVIIITEKLSAY